MSGSVPHCLHDHRDCTHIPTQHSHACLIRLCSAACATSTYACPSPTCEKHRSGHPGRLWHARCTHAPVGSALPGWTAWLPHVRSRERRIASMHLSMRHVACSASAERAAVTLLAHSARRMLSWQIEHYNGLAACSACCTHTAMSRTFVRCKRLTWIAFLPPARILFVRGSHHAHTMPRHACMQLCVSCVCWCGLENPKHVAMHVGKSTCCCCSTKSACCWLPACTALHLHCIHAIYCSACAVFTLSAVLCQCL